MSDHVDTWERTLCAVELLTLLNESQHRIIALLLTQDTISRSLYIAQMRIITEELNRLHSRALNYQNAAQLAENRGLHDKETQRRTKQL